MKPFIRKLLTGLTLPQQYICLGVNSFTDSLRVMATGDQTQPIDVTDAHIFLGYQPLIIALPGYACPPKGSNLWLSFVACHASEKAIAKIRLSKNQTLCLDGEDVSLFEGVSASHSFISAVHQVSNSFRERFRKELPGNVGLKGNLYDQVRIAYSVPRMISVITIKDGDMMNVFPTDLHGQVSEKVYASSLRLNGKATEQVEKYGELVITDVASAYFAEIYSLGKNHMRDLQDKDNFRLSETYSKEFSHPLPKGAIRYRELKWRRSIDIGIHRIHLYDILTFEIVADGDPLGHIHQYVAEWRLKNHLSTKMLLR